MVGRTYVMAPLEVSLLIGFGIFIPSSSHNVLISSGKIIQISIADSFPAPSLHDYTHFVYKVGPNISIQKMQR